MDKGIRKYSQPPSQKPTQHSSKRPENAENAENELKSQCTAHLLYRGTLELTFEIFFLYSSLCGWRDSQTAAGWQEEEELMMLREEEEGQE